MYVLERSGNIVLTIDMNMYIGEQWKFKKVRDAYLLQHKYDPTKLPKKEFKIFLDYIDGMKGLS